MATLTIRNLPPEVYEGLKERARQHRRSLTQEAAFIIEEAVGRAASPGEIWRQVDRVREVIRSRYGGFRTAHRGFVRTARGGRHEFATYALSTVCAV